MTLFKIKCFVVDLHDPQYKIHNLGEGLAWQKIK